MNDNSNYQIYTSKLKIYSLAALAGMLSTAFIGGVVKAYNAGMACGPDWPHCNGSLLPLDLLTNLPVFLEYIHRVVGGLAYLFTLAMTVTSFKLDNTMLKATSLLALLALTVQVLLGMMVVRTYLDTLIVSFHLTFALISIVTTTFIATIAYLGPLTRGCR